MSTTERDELIEILHQTATDDRVKNAALHLAPVVMAKVEETADAILAAGYSKQGTELAKAMRGAKTLGEIIEKQCRDVLDVTGLHHLINEDGDGHWDVVWMRLFEMRDELAGLKESTIGRERLRGDRWRDRAQEMEVSRDAAVERAEAAEQDRKPSTVTTLEELGALPVGSVVLCRDRSWQRYEPRKVDALGFYSPYAWRCPDGGFVRLAKDGWTILPATVLHEPEGNK